MQTSLGLTCPVSDHGRAPGRACATTGRGPASSWHRVRSPFPLRLPVPSGGVYVGDPERYPHPGKPAHRGALLEYLTPQGTSPVAGSAALCVLAAVAAWAIRVPCSPSVGQQAVCHWLGSPIDPPPLQGAGVVSSFSIRTVPGPGFAVHLSFTMKLSLLHALP